MPNHAPYPKLIAGVVGAAASGKDTVSEMLQTYGFRVVSASDHVRSEIAARSMTTSRALQTQVANEMRHQHGEGYWVEESLRAVDGGSGRIAVSGIYAEGEGRFIKQRYGGYVIGVVTAHGEDDAEKRFARLNQRKDGARDQISATEFFSAHQRENAGETIYDANIATLLKLADFLVVNDSDWSALEAQVAIVAQNMIGENRE